MISTANGPVLNNGDYWGRFIANIGDLNNDGVNDIVFVVNDLDDRCANGNNILGMSGAVHIMFMNTDGDSVDIPL